MKPYYLLINTRLRLLRDIRILYLNSSYSSSFLILLFPFFLTHCDKPPHSHKFIIGISQIVEHSALDEARKGIEDVLLKEFGVDKIDIVYRNSQGNIAIAKQIAQNLVDINPSIVVGISTPSAQALKSTLKNSSLPMVFTCVTDPVAAGLVKDINTPFPGITGVLDTPPLEKQLKMMLKILPRLKRLGFMYNPGEPNSVATIARMKTLCQQAGIEVIEASVTKSSEVASTARYIMPKVSAVYVPQDNILVSTMAVLANISHQLKVPIFASDNGSVKEGALATISYSYYEIGVETGRKIAKILKGAKPEALPIVPPAVASFYKNEKVAQKLNIILP